MTAHAAFLRVYEPLAAFEGAERQRWERFVAEQSAPDTDAGPVTEREASLRAMVGRVPVVLPDLPELAYVTEVDGVTLVCPWRTRLRALEALDEFAAVLPDEVLQAFLPLSLAASVGAELDAWRLGHPELRSHQITSTWQVPLRWFVLVEANERAIQLGAPTVPAGTAIARTTGRSLIYRTAMSRARRRTARALAVLRRSVDDGVVTAGVEDLGRWLEEFHPRSLVELDYGGLVHLMEDRELEEDVSARDIALALASLSEGDPARAAAAYRRVTERMNALQAVENAS